MAAPAILAALAVAYVLSPVDVIPDMPVVGYVDDFFLAGAVAFYALERWCEGSSAVLSEVFGWFKWAVIFLGISAVSLVGLAAWGIVKLFGG
ncbi:MAG: DUF1232 domain-containing protein [Candidatus Methylomirabilota bacterium]